MAIRRRTRSSCTRMEHGRVIFWVKPSLPEDQRANLRALVDDDSYQMFLVPRSEHAVRRGGDRLGRRPGAQRDRQDDDLHRGQRPDLRRARAHSATSTARRAPSRPVVAQAPGDARCAAMPFLCAGWAAQPVAAIGVGAVMKLLASAAALLCVLCLVPPALAAKGAADFERASARTGDVQESLHRGPSTSSGCAGADALAPTPTSACGARAAGAAGSTSVCTAGASRTRSGSAARGPSSTGSAGACPGCGPLRRGRRGRPCARGPPGVDTPFPYVTREEWGADQCPPRAAPEYGQVKAVAGPPHGVAERLHA